MYSQEIGDSEVDEVESPEVTKVPQVMVRPCYNSRSDGYIYRKNPWKF